jgi:hypothetical protein
MQWLKNGLSEENHLTAVGCQSEAMVEQDCSLLRPCSEKVMAVGGCYWISSQAIVIAHGLETFSGL